MALVQRLIHIISVACQPGINYILHQYTQYTISFGHFPNEPALAISLFDSSSLFVLDLCVLLG